MKIKLEQITKVYPGVVALDHVSMSFIQGEVHALMGENGAGKSTLIKIISGAISPSSGRIEINGKSYEKMTPSIAAENSISVIYQDVDLVQPLSIAENIFLGTDRTRIFSKRKLCEMAQSIFDEFNINLNPEAPVMSLSPAKQQMVEIAKAISHKAKFLIMDEPTAPLAEDEVELLFSIIHKLKSRGVTILYISHRLDEVFAISDRISILRDGKFIKTLKTKETKKEELINLMVGRTFGATMPPRLRKPGSKVVLEAKNLSGNSNSNISFKLYEGEILGIGGLVGSGRSELAEMICGTKKIESGTLLLNGKIVNFSSPKDALSVGIGLIPEDRKKQGCIKHASILFNITLSCDKKYTVAGVMNSKRRKSIASHYKEAIDIKAPSLSTPVDSLSGGNQQKVVVTKALATDLNIIFFDEPTKGIDVGAKYEIYEMMNQLTLDGKSIVMISSDMEELLGMSDRIIVLSEGECAGELNKENFSQKNVMTLASGISL